MVLKQDYRAVRHFIAALTLMVFAAAGLAAASEVVGVWECVSITPDGDEMHTTLTVTEANGKLSATLKSEEGEWTISNVKFEGKVLSFTAAQDAEYNVTLKVDGDKMDGQWSGGGDSGKVTATRHKA